VTFPVYHITGVQVRCEMCGLPMMVRKADEDGEVRVLSKGRNVVVLQDLQGNMVYGYVCDRCLTCEADRV
jgi:hypothetical protein